jgi:hypothetical protein
MTRPSPASIRFVGRSAKARAPAPPFGLSGWSEQGEAVAVQLDGAADDLSSAESVLRQIPNCGSFEGRTLVVVLGSAARGGGAWRKLVFMSDVAVPRAARCSALVMRGYVDVGASTDEATSQDLAWGWSQPALPVR